MRRLLGFALGLALVGGALVVADDPPKSPAEELKQLQKTVADAQMKASTLHRRMIGVDDADVMKNLSEQLLEANIASKKAQTESYARAIVIAKENAKDEAALDAFLWVLPSLRTKPAESKELLALVVEHHVANKKITTLITMLTPQAANDPKVLDTLELIAQKNPVKSVQAAALFAVADTYRNQAERRGWRMPGGGEALTKKAEAGYQRIQKEFADETMAPRGTYGPAAKAALAELGVRGVGKTVPDIEGEDTDGAVFKLSDYRGKVVMLDFWGHW